MEDSKTYLRNYDQSEFVRVSSCMIAPIQLLQFIGVALPAVAILLRVVHRISDDNSEPKIAVRLIKVSLLGLVVAGLLFTLRVLVSVDDRFLKWGVVFVLIALGALAPGLLTMSWPTSDTVSLPLLETSARHEDRSSWRQAPTEVWVSILFSFLIALVGAVLLTLDTSLPTVAPPQSPDRLSLFVFAFLFTAVVGTAVWLQTVGEEREQERQQLLSILNETAKKIPETINEPPVEQMEDLSDDASEARGELKTTGLDLGPERTRLRGRLNDVSKAASDLADVTKQIRTHERELAELRREADKKRDELEDSSLSDTRRTELEAELSLVEEYCESTDDMLSEYEDRRDTVVSDLADGLGESHKLIEELRQQVDSG